MISCRQVVGLNYCWNLNVVVNDVTNLSSFLRFRDFRTVYCLNAFWNFREVLANHSFGFGVIQVTCDCQRSIIWYIKILVELLKFFNGRCIQVIHGTNWCPLVGMRGIGSFQRLRQDSAVRLILVTLSALLLHHLTLGLYPSQVHFGVEHALTFHVQCQIQFIGREQLVVVGDVVGSVSIERSASALNYVHILTAINVLGTFKHQVLKEVSKACTLWIFIFRAHVVKYGGHHNRRGFVLVHDHMKSIVQGKFLEFDFSLSRQRKDNPSQKKAQKENFFHKRLYG